MMKPVLGTILLAAIAAAPTTAQETQRVGSRPVFVLEPGQITIGSLIDKSAQFLSWNILVNEQELASSCPGGSQIQLQNRIEVDKAGCEDLLTTLLQTKAIALRTLDTDKNLYEAISLNGSRSRDVFASAPQRTPEEILARPNLRMPVMTSVPLENINAVVACNALRPFFAAASGAQGINIGCVGNVSAILLSGMQDQVANAIRLVKTSDVPPPAEHPSELAEEVKNLKERVARLEQLLEKTRKEF